MLERIDIKLFDLPNERIIESRYYFIEFSEDYILISAEYYSKVPVSETPDDHSMGWKDKYTNYTNKVRRERAVSIDKIWRDKNEHWEIQLEFDGYSQPLYIYFETKQEADDFFEKIDKFIFNKQ